MQDLEGNVDMFDNDTAQQLSQLHHFYLFFSDEETVNDKMDAAWRRLQDFISFFLI